MVSKPPLINSVKGGGFALCCLLKGYYYCFNFANAAGPLTLLGLSFTDFS